MNLGCTEQGTEARYLLALQSPERTFNAYVCHKFTLTSVAVVHSVRLLSDDYMYR